VSAFNSRLRLVERFPAFHRPLSEAASNLAVAKRTALRSQMMRSLYFPLIISECRDRATEVIVILMSTSPTSLAIREFHAPSADGRLYSIIFAILANLLLPFPNAARAQFRAAPPRGRLIRRKERTRNTFSSVSFKKRSEERWHQDIVRFISAWTTIRPCGENLVSMHEGSWRSDYYHIATAADDDAIRRFRPGSFSYVTRGNELAAVEKSKSCR